MNLMLVLYRFVFLVAWICRYYVEAQSTALLSGFDRPEDLVDLINTPYIFVSEQAPKKSRQSKGTLSLLDTTVQQRVEFTEPLDTSSAVRSILADPACTNRPLDELSPHGNDAILNPTDGTWEIAVLNHFAYESVEFYHYDPVADPTRLVAKGCVRLGTNGLHNDLFYHPDGDRLAVTLFLDKHFDFLLGGLQAFGSLLFKRSKTGGLRIVSVGGAITTINDSFNSPNGVYWDGTNDRLFVSSTARGDVTTMDAQTGALFPVTLRAKIFPDNICRDGPTSFIFTKVDCSLFVALMCNFGLHGFCKKLDFSVMRYDFATQELKTVVSQKGIGELGQISVALIKENVLYIGSFMSSIILRIYL